MEKNNTKYKIGLMVSNICKKGGVERVAVNLSNELNKYYDCSIMTRWQKGECPYYIDNKIKIMNLYSENKKIQHISFVGLYKICRYVRKENIKTLLVIGKNNGIIPFFVKMFTDIKLVYCEHNAYEYYKYEEENIIYKIFRKTIEFLLKYVPDYVVTLTERELYYHINDLAKSCAISNFIDDKLLIINSEYDSSSKNIISVGRIDYQKGYEFLIEVAKKVLEKHPDWTWDVYGDGSEPYKSSILNMVKNSGLDGKLNFKGNTDKIYNLYQNYSLYVMTSRYEGLPMVLLEAKAKNLPIISFNINSGPSDIVRDGVDGYLIKPFEIENMINKIDFLINDKEERKRLSNNACRNLGKFKKDNIINKWIELINSLNK